MHPTNKQASPASRRLRRVLIGTLRVLTITAVISVMIISYVQVSCWLYPTQGRPESLPSNALFDKVTLQTEDGLTLTAWYAPPKNGYTLLMFHGLGGNRTQLAGSSRFLLPEGYGMFLLDFRNHGESEGTQTSMGFHERKDARAAYRYLEQLPETESIVLWGHSMGGAVASVLMAEVDADGLIIDATFSDFPSVVRAGVELRGFPASPFTEILTTLYGALAQADWSQVRPIDSLASVDKPILLLHGTDDPIIPIAEAFRLAEANSNIQLDIFEGGAHGNLFSREPQRYRDLILAYLESVQANSAP
jgi:pimeloyl-ACP methyl ester carboxylesterase